MSLVSDLLLQIKEESSTKKKEALILDALTFHYDELFPVFRLALDPSIRFGVILPTPKKEDIDQFPNNLGMIRFLELIEEYEYRFTNQEDRQQLKSYLTMLSYEDALVAVSMINKDLNIGAGAKQVNKCLKKLNKPLIRILQPMKAYKETDSDLPPTPFKLDVKVDAARAFLVVDSKNEEAYFLSANGKRAECFDHITFDAINALNAHSETRGTTAVIDGEVIATEDDGSYMPRPKSNGLFNKAVKGTLSVKDAAKFCFIVWDFLPSVENDPEYVLYNGCYEPASPVRQEMLERFVETHTNLRKLGSGNGVIRMVPSQIVQTEEEARNIVAEWISNGEEGGVAKSIDTPYEPKRSKKLVKLKKNFMADVRITGLNEGKNEGTLGSLQYETDDGLVSGDVSGICDELKGAIWSDPDEYIGKIIEVRYMELSIDKRTQKHTLYGPPVFVRFRDDKEDTSLIEELK